MSIQTRTILVLNVLVIGLAGVQVYVARDTAAHVVEERLSWQMSAGVSAFLQNRSFPLNDTMMVYLRDIFHTDWVVSEGASPRPVGSSLPPAQTAALISQIPPSSKSDRAVLEGRSYLVSSQSISRKDLTTGGKDTFRLWMLVPETQLDAVRSEATSRMLCLFLPTLLLATGVAFLLSFTIARPIRRLVHKMDDLARQASLGGSAQARVSHRELVLNQPMPGGATEIVKLSNSFQHLLRELQSAHERLTRQERLATLGKFCVSVAHEVRNPLSGIKMNVRVLKDELASNANRTGIDIILREIDRMDLYLQELMNLAGGKGGPQRKRDLRLTEIADGVLAILSGRCRHAHIEIERFYEASGPMVWADEAQVRQAVMNLLVNAIEAMPQGGTLRVKLASMSGEVRFSVSDTGEGVRCEPGRDIFDAFVSGKPGGLGLGLFLTRQAVESNGGSVGHKSTEQGATFWFDLPVKQAERGASTVSPTIETAGAA